MRVMLFWPGRVILALIACFAISVSQAAVLSFEGFGIGQIIDDEYAVNPPPGTVVGAVNLSAGPNAAIIFDTNMPSATDLDLAAPFDSPNPALPDNYYPGNVLIIQELNDCNFVTGFCTLPDDEGSSPAGEFEFLFNAVVTLESLDFFDIEFNENNNDPDSEIHLFDINDNEILPGAFYVPNTNGDNMWNQLDFGSVAGVKRMVVEMNGSGAIDNLTFSVIPLPAAFWLFGSAVGLLGWLRRKAS